jgi:5-methylcytosine-specific restriction endonuclease McrA
MSKFSPVETTLKWAGNGTHVCCDCLGPKKKKYGSDRCGSCGVKRRPPISDETREKLRTAKLGYRHSKETIAKFSASNMGHPVSEETRSKLRAIFAGRRPSQKTMDRLREANLGRIPSLETRLKMSASRTGKKKSPEATEKLRLSRLGEKSHFWRGGGGYAKYGPEFNRGLKRFIRERDQCLCQRCYLPENGKKHHVHHIDFNKKNNHPTNLILLCGSCHPQTTLGDRLYWEEYYRGLMELRHA